MSSYDYGRYNGEPVKCKFTFDNDETYEASSLNKDNNVIQQLHIHKKESENNLNPLGIMTSNTIGITIVDKDRLLVPTNTSSPYYGYMRSGVKVELWVKKDNSWEEMGIYYTKSWDSSRGGDGDKPSNISCQDRLNYIGGMEMPELESYASVNMVKLLEDIFKGIGLTEDDYEIDDGLDRTLNVSVRKGERVRDNLNSIAQALLARIIIGDNGKIYVKKAFPTMSSAKTINGDCFKSISIKDNPDVQYNKVILKYSDFGVKTSEPLAEVDNILINQGENNIRAISISDRTQGIECISVMPDISNVTVSNYDNIITDVLCQGFQGGVDVKFYSSYEEQVKGKISILGRIAGASTKSISLDIPERDNKVSNTLIIVSEFIQSDSQASDYLLEVVDYLGKMSTMLVVESNVVPYINNGEYIEIQSNVDIIAGIYYIISIDITFSPYSNKMTMVKVG